MTDIERLCERLDAATKARFRQSTLDIADHEDSHVTVKLIKEASAALRQSEQKLREAAPKAQVMHDLHAALGVKWGCDPYARINELKQQERFKWKANKRADLAEQKAARYREWLEELLNLAERSHYYCDDPYYSCPQHPESIDDEFPEPCDCGADKHNERVAAIRKGMRRIG